MPSVANAMESTWIRALEAIGQRHIGCTCGTACGSQPITSRSKSTADEVGWPAPNIDLGPRRARRSRPRHGANPHRHSVVRPLRRALWRRAIALHLLEITALYRPLGLGPP